MKLVDWMWENRLRICQLSRLCGVDQSCITMHINHGRRMGRTRAERIEKATSGAVTAVELMFPEIEFKILKKRETNKNDKKNEASTQSNDAIAC